MSKIGELGMNAANTAAGQVLGLAFGGIQDARQRKQAKALGEIQLGQNKAAADYSNKLAKDMWDYTNYENQVKHAEKAGLNPGLLYGGAGGGGSTAGGSVGGVSGASPTDPSAATGMGLQMGAQLALMKAQKENIEADTRNKEAGATKTEGVDTQEAQARIAKTSEDTTAQKFANDVNDMFGVHATVQARDWANQKLERDNTKEMAEWEAWQAGSFEGKTWDNPNSPIAKATRAGYDKTITELQIAKKDNNIKAAEEAIKEFEAGLAKQGISPNTPWYVKMVTDLLDKVGLSPIKAVQKAIK